MKDRVSLRLLKMPTKEFSSFRISRRRRAVKNIWKSSKGIVRAGLQWESAVGERRSDRTNSPRAGFELILITKLTMFEFFFR
jgi:hypothetical protein